VTKEKRTRGKIHVRLKKRALHLAVTASMVGTFVTAVGVQPAHGATVLDDACGVMLQGSIDPAGGLIPSGLIPAPAGVNTAGQHAYVVTGHESKGQNKILSDLNNTADGAKRFSLGVTLGGTITGNTAASGPVAPLTNTADGQTTIKLQWKNDKTPGAGPTAPQVQVYERDAVTKVKANVSKGFVIGVPGGDSVGPQIGNIQNGQALPPQDTTFNLVTPALATSGSFVLAMDFPAYAPPPLGGTTVSTAAISYDASAASIASALNTAFAAVGGGVSVTGTDFNAGTATNGDYTIDFGGAFTDSPLPSLYVDAASTTGDLATTVLDDGSIWNATRNGGVDPSITPITDLGQGVYTSSGVMSSGAIPAPGAKTTGKWKYVPDTQYLFLQYPVALVDAASPGLSGNTTAQGILQSIIGTNLTVTTDQCGLLGILALFCSAASAQIPPAFLGICGLL
jgi:hypothetical protein